MDGGDEVKRQSIDIDSELTVTLDEQGNPSWSPSILVTSVVRRAVDRQRAKTLKRLDDLDRVYRSLLGHVERRGAKR